MGIIKDKIIVDCNGEENAALAEKLSRAEPGDEITFRKVVGSLDEYENGVAVISLTEVEVGGGKAAEKEPAEEAGTEDGAAEPAASVALFKGKSAKKETE